MSKLSLQFGDLIYVNPEVNLSIRQAFILPQGTPVAVKRTIFRSPQEANLALREVFNMALVTHPAILRVYDCYFDKSEEGDIAINIVSELMQTDLGKEVKRRNRSNLPFSESELWSIFRSLISALSYAEQRGVSHRDIKPDNIFMTESTVKIGDFGFSTQAIDSKMQSTLLGSPFFLSPELKREYLRQLASGMAGIEYEAVKSDVYSLGVTMVYLALLSPPSSLANLDHLEEATASVLSQLDAYPSLRTWLIPMLSSSPAARPSFCSIEAAIIAPTVSHMSVPSAEKEVYLCLECKREIVSMCWTESVAQYLKPFKGFFEVCCSEACLEARANTFPRTLCAICGSSLDEPEGVCLLKCGHSYHFMCRQRLPARDSSAKMDCPQCCPDLKLQNVSLNMVANGWSEESLMRSILAVPRFQQPHEGQAEGYQPGGFQQAGYPPGQQRLYLLSGQLGSGRSSADVNPMEVPKEGAGAPQRGGVVRKG